MKKLILFAMVLVFASYMSATAAHATSATIAFTKLSGLTGGSPAGTAVYRADLSGLGLVTIESLSIQDSNLGGGSPGKFSGFDLDAIKLANSAVGDASLVNALAGLGVFNFSPAGTLFVAGTQTPPVDPGEMFGTAGGNIDNAVATLGAFDGNSATDITAFGFVSLGNGGKVAFNLTGPLSTTNLFLYIGEVGDNGEVASGTISASDGPVVPAPATLYLFGSGLIGLLGFRAKFRI
ncbi:MAG: PEP-CTERM sorting domain-containing protein [Desulfobaccales bacterium]